MIYRDGKLLMFYASCGYLAVSRGTERPYRIVAVDCEEVRTEV